MSASAATLRYQDFAAEGLAISIDLPARAPARLRVRADSVSSPALPSRLAKLQLECAQVESTAEELSCRGGSLAGELATLGRQQLAIDASWAAQADRLQARISNASVAGGRLALDLTVSRPLAAAPDWHAAMQLSGADLEALLALGGLSTSLPQGMTMAGRMSGKATISGLGSEPTGLTLDVKGEALGFASSDGTAAAETLAPHVRMTARRERPARDWSFDGRLELGSGQVYFEPVFLDFGAHSLTAQARGAATADGRHIRLDAFELRHDAVFSASGSAAIEPQAEVPLRSLRLALGTFSLATAVPAYLQPVLVGTPFKDLAGEGSVSGRIDVDDGKPSRVELDLAGISLDSPASALGIAGLGGRLRWYDEERRLALANGQADVEFGSEMRFDSARLWGVPIGAARLAFATSGPNFRLTEPAFMPVFDGGLAVDTLRVRQAGLPGMYVRLDAAIRPINIAAIGRALGWPEFGGTLSGSIPKLTLEDGLVTLGGNLEAQVFDGRVTVRNLRLKEPLGQFPQMFADIDVDALDLEQITSAFEFGRITGRLSGKVAGLQTFAWQPLSFDGRLYSTPGDRTKRRISQRAVANLSSIGGGSGGGVAAALQGGFLQFFEEFNYKQLGISCRLRNDVCTVDGIAPARYGYYIVEGSGVPRIDVIGSQRRVAWTRLLRQLVAVTTSGGAVVK